ncbi:CvpA family protein [Sphingomonas sp. KRR8]|uniref:CvpA family protein n=1 Tax=Sphingomonas sp. KRR8 TaxID=2942996 RepID=UPI0020202B53|nr:CvpA family protein [Sphingomonas sp. KRR8]URD61198.1 CvpA family protein [Sphingomonas sp. KRR8]
MTALDIFVLVLLGGGALVGFVRGFVHEVLSLAAWLAAVVALKLFHAPVTGYVMGFGRGPASAAIIAYAILFLAPYFIVRVIATRAGHASRRSVLGPVDRFLGGGFGMLKGLVGATLVFLLANFATDMRYGPTSERPEWMTRSRTFPLLNASAHAIVDMVDSYRHSAPTKR